MPSRSSFAVTVARACACVALARIVPALLVALALAGIAPHAEAAPRVAAPQAGDDDPSAGMKRYYLGLIYGGPAWTGESSESTRELMRGHLARIEELVASGQLVLAGPVEGEAELRGLFVYDVATEDEARALAQSDPAVRAGRLRVELLPWWGPARLATLFADDAHAGGADGGEAHAGATRDGDALRAAIVEAACGQCQLGLSGDGCELAIRIDGRVLRVAGTDIDDHGDAHADDGFCNAVRRARVTGTIDGETFVAESFELLADAGTASYGTTDAAPPRERTLVSRTAPMGEHRIRYDDSGGTATDALVLVHGWASSTATWAAQLPELAQLGRVLAVDLLGHGGSDAPEVEYTAALLADSIAAAMDDAGVERAVLVGHSNGVPVSLEFLARHPRRTLGVVGIDGAITRVVDRGTFDAIFGRFRGPGWREALAAMIAGMAGPHLSELQRDALTAMALATPHHVVVGAAEAMIEPAPWADVPIEVPLLLVLARQPTWDDVYAHYVRERAPRVDYRVWDGVGHFLQLERPAELHAAIEEFLAANELLR